MERIIIGDAVEPQRHWIDVDLLLSGSVPLDHGLYGVDTYTPSLASTEASLAESYS